MNTTSTITARLIEKSDCKLREDIEQASKPLWGLLNTGEPHKFKTTKTDPQVEVEVYFRESFRAIKELAFNINQKRRQDEAIQGFMRQVEELDAKLEDIHNNLQQ